MCTMANDNLRAALAQAGLQPDDLAQIVEVDVKTVRRWLTGTPHTRDIAEESLARWTPPSTPSGPTVRPPLPIRSRPRRAT